MAGQKNQSNHQNRLYNIIHFPQVKNFNLTYIAIAFLAAYIVFTMAAYLVTDNVAEYEVSKGVIAANNVYKGLIIRDEKVIYAPASGYINYYVKQGTKIAAEDNLYSIDTKGDIAAEINKETQTSSSLDSAELSTLLESIDGFTNSYNNNDFVNVYSFKQDFSSDLNQSLAANALANLTKAIEKATENNTFYMERTGADGIVAYYVDGMESYTTSNFDTSKLTSAGYTRTSLEQNTEIKQGDPVCKLISSESWNIVFPISDERAQELSNTSTLKVCFTKDDFTTIASCSIMKNEGQYYLSLTMKSGMVRYLGDRYEEVELLLGDTTGLKIPSSAIVEKEFYQIPITCFNGTSSPYLLIRKSEHSTNTEKLSPSISYTDDQYYYISVDSIADDAIIQMPDSSDTYAITEDIRVSLPGVFNINKGYAVYKCIHILSQNDDYAIVESGTSYGIALYDHIALDGSKVNENKIISK